MVEIRSHLKRAKIDSPEIDPAELATGVFALRQRGIGERKREEVRFLILAGVPHAEVVRRTGVSSGTVSSIRQELKARTPLYRNSEPVDCVPFACRDPDDEGLVDSQTIEKIGGPGRIRTCDNTVMSGAF